MVLHLRPAGLGGRRHLPGSHSTASWRQCTLPPSSRRKVPYRAPLTPPPAALGSPPPPPPPAPPPPAPTTSASILLSGFHADEIAAVNAYLTDEYDGEIGWRVVDVADALGPAWSAAVVDPAAGQAAAPSTPPPDDHPLPHRLGRVAYLLAPPSAIAGGAAAHYPAALNAALEDLGLWPAVTGGAVKSHAGLPLGAALGAVRAAHARHHGLDLPLLTAADVGTAAAAFPPGAAVTCHALLDAAPIPAWRFTSGGDDDDADDEPGGGAEEEEEEEEDASAVVVLDGLLTPFEAADLLEAMTEPGWDAASGGPPPESSWERSTADREGDAPTWGARPGLVDRLLADRSPASPFAALQARLAALYAPDYTLAFSPGEACDAGLTPLVANAVCAGDPAAYHVDADPACLDPAGAWAALHGLHPNRTPGTPLMMSAIVYLQDWDVAEHNGETLFLDEGTGLGLMTAPRAGRVVLMEGDVPHRIVPPSADAPGPRFSLVLKLIMHPTGGSGGGRWRRRPTGLLRPEWGPPLRIGTAGVRGPVPLV